MTWVPLSTWGKGGREREWEVGDGCIDLGRRGRDGATLPMGTHCKPVVYVSLGYWQFKFLPTSLLKRVR